MDQSNCFLHYFYQKLVLWCNVIQKLTQLVKKSPAFMEPRDTSQE